jgi:hypothetical protein
MGVDCTARGGHLYQKEIVAANKTREFFSDPYKNDHKQPLYYQSVVAAVKYSEKTNNLMALHQQE